MLVTSSKLFAIYLSLCQIHKITILTLFNLQSNVDLTKILKLIQILSSFKQRK